MLAVILRLLQSLMRWAKSTRNLNALNIKTASQVLIDVPFINHLFNF